MVHAHPDPRSFRLDTGTLPPPSQARQAAAKREAEIDDYVARVVSEAPKRSDEFLDRIAVLLRPQTQKSNGTPFVTEAQYRSLEYRRYLDSETPGKFGFFAADGEAAA